MRPGRAADRRAAHTHRSVPFRPDGSLRRSEAPWTRQAPSPAYTPFSRAFFQPCLATAYIIERSVRDSCVYGQSVFGHVSLFQQISIVIPLTPSLPLLYRYAEIMSSKLCGISALTSKIYSVYIKSVFWLFARCI